MTPEERKDWERRLAIMRGQQLASSGPLADPILGRTEGSILQSHGLRPNLGLINQDRDRVVLDYLESKRPPTETTVAGGELDPNRIYEFALKGATTPSIDPSAIPTPTPTPTPAAPVIPSGGGLSAAAQNRINELQNKWGGYMDAHAFATGARSRRGSFDASLKSAFGTAKDEFQTIEHGNLKYTMHRNPQTGEWTVIAAAPRWEPKQWSTHKDINGRARFSEGPHMGRLLSEVAGQPMVEKEQKAEFTELADGRKYWVTGPKAGQLVLDKDLKRAPDPTEDIKEYEYAENLLRVAAKARQDHGVDSQEYLNAAGEYNRFVARSTTAQSRTEDIKEYEYLNSLTTIADNMKAVHGENSSQYIAAKADADRFAAQITKGTTQGYKPEVRLFHRLTPVEGEQAQVAGYIDYTGDKPVFRDMNGDVLSNVVPIPKAEITTTQQDFIQTLTPVKTAIGEGVVGQLDTAVEIEQFKNLLVDLEELGAGATGLRGVAMEKIGGPLGQLNPILERGFSQAIGGVTAEEAANYRNRLRLAVISLIPEYTGEESGRITEAERQLASEASRLLSPAASEIQIRSALRNVLELKLTEQMRSWISAGFAPRHDLTTKEGVNDLGDILFNAGFKEKDVIASLTRLTNIQKEMQRTYLGSQ